MARYKFCHHSNKTKRYYYRQKLDIKVKEIISISMTVEK